MEFAHHLILVGAGLVVLAILAGLVSSRIGTPLLMVFLSLALHGAPTPSHHPHASGALVVRVVKNSLAIRDGLDGAQPPSARNHINGLCIGLLALWDGLRQAMERIIPARFR